MRVGFVLQDGSREASGLDTYVWNLWDALCSMEGDHELVPVTLPERMARRAYLRLLWEQVYLPLWVRRAKLDLLHVPAGSVPVLSGAPSVLTLHDLGDDASAGYRTPAGPRTYFGRLVPWSARFADLVITDSAAIRREAIARLRIPDDQLRVVPLAAPPWCTRAPGEAVQAMRARYDLGDPFFLQVGAGIPRKNLRGALAAFIKLLARVPDLPVRFVATGRMNAAELDPEIAELAQRGVIRFVGHVPRDDLAALYTGALAVLVPSFYEGFGLPLVEAFACGTPGIASRVASLLDVGGAAALYVDPAEPESIADAMAQYAMSPEFRREMSDQAVARSRQFTWERTARETLDAYRRVMRPTGRRRNGRQTKRPTLSAPAGSDPGVLFVRLDSLGDVVLTTPCFDALRRTYPNARIDIVVQPNAAPLVEGDHRIHHVFTLAPPWRGHWSPAHLVATARRLRELRRRRYDFVISPRRDLDDALFARLCAGRVTVGFEARRTRPFLSRWMPFDSGRHTVDNQLRLMTLLGCDGSDIPPSIACTPADRDRIDRLLLNAGDAHAPIALAPFGSSKAKCLSAAKCRALISALAEATSSPMVLLGAEENRSWARALIRSGAGSLIDLVGRTSIPELCAVLRRCRLLVSVDSGPMHIAAALGVPVVALFGTEDPALWAPCGRAPHRVLQAHDERGRPSLETIPVERLVAAVQELLASSEAGQVRSGRLAEAAL